jgi:hypothetical protein
MRATAEFDVKLVDYQYFITVKVYENRKDLRKAINMWNIEHELSLDSINIEGVFCPQPSGAFLGTILLNKQDLSVPLIVHESLHATVAYVKNGMKYSSFFEDSRSGDDPEERMAYAIQNFVEGTIKGLKKRRLVVK